MKLSDANVIVGTYDAVERVRGKELADKNYLGAGTSRYERNKSLLDEARRVVEKAKKKSQKGKK